MKKKKGLGINYPIKYALVKCCIVVVICLIVLVLLNYFGAIEKMKCIVNPEDCVCEEWNYPKNILEFKRFSKESVEPFNCCEDGKNYNKNQECLTIYGEVGSCEDYCVKQRKKTQQEKEIEFCEELDGCLNRPMDYWNKELETSSGYRGVCDVLCVCEKKRNMTYISCSGSVEDEGTVDKIETCIKAKPRLKVNP